MITAQKKKKHKIMPQTNVTEPTKPHTQRRGAGKVTDIVGNCSLENRTVIDRGSVHRHRSNKPRVTIHISHFRASICLLIPTSSANSRENDWLPKQEGRGLTTHSHIFHKLKMLPHPRSPVRQVYWATSLLRLRMTLYTKKHTPALVEASKRIGTQNEPR